MNKLNHIPDPKEVLKLSAFSATSTLSRLHSPGACVATRGRGLATRVVIQTSQVIGMLDLPKAEGGPLGWGSAWSAARWRHIASLASSFAGVNEMTHPRARFRGWREMIGEEFMVLDFDMEEQTAWVLGGAIDARMREIARQQVRYPRRELIANTALIAKWLRKLMGDSKFHKLFTYQDRSVCGGTYVEAVSASRRELPLLIEGELFPGLVQSWTPARICYSGPWGRKTIYRIVK